MAVGDKSDSDNSHTKNTTELERSLGDNPKIVLKGGGKTKLMNLEQLRKPHCIKPNPRVSAGDAGGLLRSGGHRPGLSEEEVSKRDYEHLHEQEKH
ncbi:hypothetical protein SEUBUCD646_0L04020 [Saccharomyces eubayanus]|uniref:Uncharacterized protein n=2 Tax=Saccharomyces TaxID=4930 RepID=A0A6C1EE74_SACPS|nr:hypothetical protein GRS66_009566 [Saccharomyces pastorianus]CAI1600967.1 hypothetical protein SEUBUCD650_0L04010 [Saccharomyces eubayanus]CAI1627345.1 hypothetical protein SEUBUCD646_0L04020 [Saccharomyces eubayanus]